MNTQFYINNAIKYGDKKVRKLYENINRPLTMVEQRLITRLVHIEEALSHEEAENLGFGTVAFKHRRAYKDVNRLLAKTCKKANIYQKWLSSVDFRQFDWYL